MRTTASLRATADGHLVETAAGDLRNLLIPHADRTRVHYLTPERPRAEL
ncbi:hypothetical protein AB0P07_27285 [Streptomyces sp. NPDC085944]